MHLLPVPIPNVFLALWQVHSQARKLVDRMDGDREAKKVATVFSDANAFADAITASNVT
jgi:hypothetical protein